MKKKHDATIGSPIIAKKFFQKMPATIARRI